VPPPVSARTRHQPAPEGSGWGLTKVKHFPILIVLIWHLIAGRGVRLQGLGEDGGGREAAGDCLAWLCAKLSLYPCNVLHHTWCCTLLSELAGPTEQSPLQAAASPPLGPMRPVLVLVLLAACAVRFKRGGGQPHLAHHFNQVPAIAHLGHPCGREQH